MHPCTFCDLIQGAAEVSVCYEDADAIAFMDIQPVNAGHVLVVPRTHYESLLDVPQELGVHLFGITMRLANAVRRVTGCEGMNLVVNSGVAAGQDVFHYHVHIIPRKKDDGFNIELPFSGSDMPDRTVLDMTAARIIAAMGDPIRTGSSPSSSGGGSGERAPTQSAAPDAARGTEPRGMRAMAENVVAIADALAERPADRPGGIAVHREPEVVPRDEREARPTRPMRVVEMEGPHGELICEFENC